MFLYFIFILLQIRGLVSEGAKRTIMIANTVPLVKQQKEAIATLSPNTVQNYDGSMGTDFWDIEKVSCKDTNNLAIIVDSNRWGCYKLNHLKARVAKYK